MCKIGTNKTEMLRRLRMCHLTPRHPPADIRVRPKEYKPDPEVSPNHDSLYARAWKIDYEQLNFDAENKNAALASTQEIPVQSDFSTEELRAHREPHTSVPQRFFPKRTKSVT